MSLHQSLAIMQGQIDAMIRTVDERPPLERSEATRLRIARRVIDARRLRARYFPQLDLSDPAWDMLLDLYVAHYIGRRISVSSLCLASGVPPTTALRWMANLEKTGHLLRAPDETDTRRVIVIATPATLASIGGWLDAVADRT